MDRTVPPAAARLLDFIGSVEAPAGYDTLYGNAQKRYPWKLTALTIGEVLDKGPTWSRKTSEGGHGSSACGRYQFMAGRGHTLQGLADELRLRPSQKFDPDLQDRLAYHLLRRRGYDEWMEGKLSDSAFALNLAKEWASLPVLSTGRSYYAGDGLNKALVTPARFLAVLAEAKRHPAPAPAPVAPRPVPHIPTPEVTTVEQTKSIFASKTFWSSAIGLGALFLPGVSDALTGVDHGQLAEQLSTIIAGLAFIGAIVFRATATKQVEIAPPRAIKRR